MGRPPGTARPSSRPPGGRSSPTAAYRSGSTKCSSVMLLLSEWMSRRDEAPRLRPPGESSPGGAGVTGQPGSSPPDPDGAPRDPQPEGQHQERRGLRHGLKLKRGEAGGYSP